MSARKHDGGKPRLDLLPVVPLEMVARVFEHGAARYGERDWERGMRYSRMYSAALRHLFAFWEGQNADEESLMFHVAHAAACCLCLCQYLHEGDKRWDDRPFASSSHCS